MSVALTPGQYGNIVSKVVQCFKKSRIVSVDTLIKEAPGDLQRDHEFCEKRSYRAGLHVMIVATLVVIVRHGRNVQLLFPLSKVPKRL